MPPRASTSKLVHDGQAQSRSPSTSVSVVKGRRAAAGGRHADSDMSTTAMMMMMDKEGEDREGEAASSDDELLDEEEEGQYGSGVKPVKGSANPRAVRTSKGRSSASASVAGDEEHQGNSTANLSKEEAALADRRRRNRETQRAIRKKKANRLQDAEVKVSVFESELEKLKVRLREMELENMSLKREIEDWRLGRIHANPSIVAASNHLHPHHRHQLPPASTARRPAPPPPAVEDLLQQHRAYDNLHQGTQYTGQSSSKGRYQPYDSLSDDHQILGKRRQSFDVGAAHHHDQHAIRTSPQNMSARRTSFGHGSPSSEPRAASRNSPSVLQPVSQIFTPATFVRLNSLSDTFPCRYLPSLVRAVHRIWSTRISRESQ